MAGEIFISYRRTDEAWARLLHTLLQAEGVEAWYDAQVGAGQDWRLATARALEASNIFVLLFTANAAQSSDIAKELAAATLEKKLIIPVRLENIAPKGAFLYELASRNWVNAYDNPEAKLAELAKGVAHLVRTGARDESVLPFDRSAGNGGSFALRKAIRAPATIAAAVVALIAASALTAWLLWPASRWAVESSRPFISTLALEGEPAFSPSGKMLAYTSGPDGGARKIYVRNLAGGDGIKVTNDAYDDTSPNWSPDGTRLAYVAQKADEPCRIMVATVPAGEARQVGRCDRAGSSSVAWQPGTQFLFYRDHVGLRNEAIFRLDLDSGARSVVTMKDSEITSDLRCSPDGKSLVYFFGDTFDTEQIVVHDLFSGKEKILGEATETSAEAWAAAAAWSEDSKTVFMIDSSGIGSQIVAYPVDGGTPYNIYTTAATVRHLAAGSGGYLALETDPSRQNLARAGLKPVAQPDIIDEANGMTWAPTFAPDGTLAFLSNRSGSNAVWIMKPGGKPVLLIDVGLSPVFRLEFSPDGTRLAAVVATDHGPTIKVLTADGATVSSFGVGMIGVGFPTWTPDSKGLVMLDLPAGHIARVDPADPSRRSAVAPLGWSGIAIRSNGTFAGRFDKPGLWRIDGGEKLLSTKYPSRFNPPIAFRDGNALIPDFNAADGPRILAQPLAGGPDRVLAYAPGARAQDERGQSKMTVNPKTGEIVYVAWVLNDTNIDLLTLAKR
jgi:Tol biopolymer transport system component